MEALGVAGAGRAEPQAEAVEPYQADTEEAVAMRAYRGIDIRNCRGPCWCCC